jgi:hypothetical protein
MTKEPKAPTCTKSAAAYAAWYLDPEYAEALAQAVADKRLQWISDPWVKHVWAAIVPGTNRAVVLVYGANHEHSGGEPDVEVDDDALFGWDG